MDISFKYVFLFRMAGELYNATLAELGSKECRMTTLQSTIFNINVAMYLTNGVCDIARGRNITLFYLIFRNPENLL